MKQADRALRWLVWILLPIGVGVDLVITGWRLQPDRSAVTWFCVVFFGVLCLRLALAIRRWPIRRTGLVVMLAGLVLWCVESASLQSTSSAAGATAHLAPGEALFLASYGFFALYLLLDVDQQPGRTIAASLDAAILCAGSACAAGPCVAVVLGGTETAAWVAVLYPVLDLTLAGLIVVQVALRVRRRDSRSLRLAVGFLMLAAADFGFVNRVVDGSTGSDVTSVVLWGAGFALLVDAASSARASRLKESIGEVPSAVVGLSAVAAIAVLLFGPTLKLGGAIALLAATTLVAAGTRLHIALRDARSAAGAIKLAQTDDLTGLPNRRAINARLTKELASSAPFGLMIMDLDGFKDVNDTLGHDYGDAILRTAAARMCDVVPRNVLVARLGGDEFALVVPTDDELELLEIARAALDEVRRPDSFEGIEIVVDASIGITVRSNEDTSGSSMLRRADVAMYQAKERSSGIAVYAAEGDEFTVRRLRLTEQIRRAVAHDQFTVHYQPQIDASDQRVVGVEALARWRHPSGTIESPLVFLPTVRSSGLMPRLGESVIRLAARDLLAWKQQGCSVRIAINCAPPELMSGIFVRQLLTVIDQVGLAAGDFVLEVTEDSFVADPERARAVLADVRAAGLCISIDDYGTGFSSLTYLRDLPVDELKIDRSFIGSMVDDERAATIVDSTIRLAHALGLRVVAEGVENAATSAALVAMGVDVMQGWHFARPLPAEDMQLWLHQWDAARLGASRRATG